MRRSVVLDTNYGPDQLASCRSPLQRLPPAPWHFEKFWSTITAALLDLMLTNLGYIAVNKAVFIIHNEVFQILRRKHLPLPHVAQTRLLQQLPAALEGPLSCQRLQLLAGMGSGRFKRGMKEEPHGWMGERKDRNRKTFQKLPSATAVSSVILWEWGFNIWWQADFSFILLRMCYNIRLLQWMQHEISKGFESILHIIFSLSTNLTLSS